MEVFAAWDVPQSPPFHDDSYPSVKQFFRYVFTDRLGQFGEHSNRWVSFPEHRWVIFGERQSLCGSIDHEVIYSKIDRVTGWEFNLVKCGCGMAFVNPMPVEESIPLLYQTDYHYEKPLLDSLYINMMKLLPSLETGRRLLDIGCGAGNFINYASKAGWDAEGVDFVDWRESKNPDVKIKVGDLPTMDIADKSYDVITAWALLEHVRYPSRFFEKIAKLLTKEGKFIFTVPNIDSPGMSHSCSEDTPKHLWLFSPETVRDYLGRYGLESETIFHDGLIYKSYPFGLVRYYWNKLINQESICCSSYQNKSVTLLKNRPMKVYFRQWISEVLSSLHPLDITVDALDLAIGIIVANIAKIIRNYGVITIVARKKS